MAVAAGRTAIAFDLFEADDLEPYLLEGKLLANTGNKFQRFNIKIVQRAQLNFDQFRRQIGKAFLKFSIKNEGEVGIKLLLELKELQLFPCPRTHLVHGKNNFVGASVMCERIKNTWMFQAAQG